MAITQVQGRLVRSDVLVSWVDSNEDSYTVTVTEYELDDPGSPTTRTVTLTAPDDLLWLDDELDTSTDRVTYLITNNDDAATGTVTVELTGAWTYGEIDANESTIRYTTLAKVKSALGIPSAQVDRDTEITDAILAAESWIDDYCGRSFPDTSANPQYAAIPNRVTRAALLLATSFYTAEMSPDALDPFEADIRTERASNMAVQLLTGFRATFGVA